MRRIISIITAGLLMCSCIYEDLSDCPSYNGKGEDSTALTKAVPVEFVISTTDTTKTKSSITVSDTKVADINIYAYYDGMLEASVYEKSPQSVYLSLMNGRTYNLYALSNMGEVEGPVSEDELIAMDYSIKAISDMAGGLPMCWSQKSLTVSGSAPKASVTLERLVSRIRFSIDKSALDGLSVTSVQLKQGALRATPFISGSKAASTSEVGDGDYATSSDITSLNSGNTVTFYALENCQGVLLPNNKEASSKVPEEIADKSALCTYLEMTASFSGQYEGVDVSSDNVKYRFYLGDDNCTDFNVIRNKDVKINLKVTEDRIFDESWRVSYGEDLPNIAYGLTNSKSSVNLNVGGSTTLSATYYRTVDGVKDTETDVTSYAAWTSSNPSVATVSGGVVTGVSAGQAVATATYRSYSKSCTVTVTKKPVTYTYALQVKLTDPTIYVGDATAATATYITYADGVQSSTKDVTSSATWSSGTTAVATVSGGTVTAIAAGTSEISASYNGYSAKASVTVEDKITYDYYLSSESVSVVNGRTTKLTAVRRTFTNGNQTYGEDYSSNFTWTSSNTSVATVGSNGVITGVGIGTANITAKYSGTTLTGTVTVTPNYTYELVLNKTSMNLTKGGTGSITATYKTYADGVLESSTNVTSSATWSSSSSSVAGVSGGTVTGNGAGSATITATYNGKSATCSVKVTGSPTLSLGWTSADLEKGDVRTNAAIYNPNNGTASTNVTSSAVWTTSNSGVATVGGGSITAQGKGTCTITATYNGVSASCTVNVTDNDTPSVNAYVSNMSVQSVNVSGTSNYKLTLTLKFSDGTVVEDAPYTWSVTYAQNTSIATGTSGDAPIVYTGGGSTYVMAVTLTTKAYYYDSNGNRRQHTTGTSFSHNVSWKP